MTSPKCPCINCPFNQLCVHLINGKCVPFQEWFNEEEELKKPPKKTKTKHFYNPQDIYPSVIML